MEPTEASNAVAGRRKSISRVGFFLVVGSLGFVTDTALLFGFVHMGLPPLVARLFSIGLATIVTWQMNRRFTFEPSAGSRVTEGVRYGSVTAFAQGASYLIFALLVVLNGTHLLASQVVGSLVGAIVSYNGHRLFSFRPGK